MHTICLYGVIFINLCALVEEKLKQVFFTKF